MKQLLYTLACSLLSLAPSARGLGSGRLTSRIAGSAEAGAIEAGEVDFPKLASAWLDLHPLQGQLASDATLAALLDAHYANAEIGAFSVRFPRAFIADKAHFGEFEDTCRALVELQVAWLDWLDAKGDEADRARADGAAILKWLGTLKPSVATAKAPDFFSGFSGWDAIQPSLEHFRDSYRSGAALGFKPAASAPQVLVISPTRQDFAELAAVMGHFDESTRNVYWNQGLIGWTELAWNDLQVLSIQYPPVEPRGDDLSQGTGMNEREPTGLRQHVAQRGAIGLCWHSFGQVLDAAVEMGMAQALVIDIYKQNNTRSGGGGRGSISAGTEAFIPGGNPNGGALPPTNADSSWRSNAGADYFHKVLRTAQTAGAKAAKSKDERIAYFQILSDKGSERRAVRAPFFGLTAGGKEVPPSEFMADYMEFFRAYKTAFVHWLREEAAGKDSHAKFAQLLKTVNEAGSAATFDELAKEVYGIALSAAGPDVESLEWRFLAELAKH